MVWPTIALSRNYNIIFERNLVRSRASIFLVFDSWSLDFELRFGWHFVLIIPSFLFIKGEGYSSSIVTVVVDVVLTSRAVGF